MRFYQEYPSFNPLTTPWSDPGKIEESGQDFPYVDLEETLLYLKVNQDNEILLLAEYTKQVFKKLMRNLMMDLLDLGQIENNKFQLNQSFFSLESAI